MTSFVGRITARVVETNLHHWRWARVAIHFDGRLTHFPKGMYAVKSQIFLSDINRIWTTAAIFVPLAFGAVAALEVSKDVTSTQRLVAGGFGFMLLLLWNLFADRQRALQDNSLSWLRSIEKVYGCARDTADGVHRPWWQSIRTHRWLLASPFAVYFVFNLVTLLGP